MNPKILLAFGAGALLAAGIVYMAVKPEAPAQQSAVPPTTNVAPAAAPLASTEPDTSTPPPDRPKASKPAPVASRRDEVAQASPAAVPAPSPATVTPQPINKERPVNDAPPPETAPPAVQPEPVRAPPREEAPPKPNSVTLAAGTTLAIRVGETLSTQRNKAGDTFIATLAEPLVIDGFVIAERGARVEGKVVESEKAGKVKGLSHITIELAKVTTSDGQRVSIHTSPSVQNGKASTKKDAAKVGGGAALGAIIGAIAGGGKGAGIGAGVGGAAGAGDVLLTRGEDASIPVETKLSFRLQEPVTITERLR